MTKQRTQGLYKVPTIKINGVWFRGQYANAFQEFMQGEEITIKNFKRGSWECTTNLQRFIDLLNQAKIGYKTYGTSFRSMVIVNVSRETLRSDN